MTPDVNVLVAAFRDDHPQHATALRWLEQARQRCALGERLVKQLVGNDLPDAWIAATVQSQGERLCTFDRGFRRLLPTRDLMLLDAGAAR